MSFEDWWKTQEEPENLLQVSIKDYAKEAWDYRQAKIDKLQAELAEYDIRNYAGYRPLGKDKQY